MRHQRQPQQPETMRLLSKMLNYGFTCEYVC